MMTDFTNWFAWYRKTYPNVTVTEEEAKAAYDAWYFCNCESCEYRKNRGHMPVAGLNPKCQLPSGRGDLNHV